jgi:hypothetical protein
MRAMQQAFPEGINDYGGDRWHVVLIPELDEAGHIVTDTRYYAQPFDPPEWRAPR